MSDPQDILIVDDDPELADMLGEYLSQQGFITRTAADGRTLDAALTDRQPDLLILDLMLPGEDGLSIARRLSERMPILMLSARGDDTDRIVGLELGADDYLAKPFNPRELVARVRAVLRRSAGPATAVDAPPLRFGPFTLNLQSHTLSRDGTGVTLTTAEFTLLKLLATHPNRVLSRDQLMDLAGTDERMPFDRSIDVRVARLRRKLGEDSNAPRYLRTVWGSGYLFTPNGEAP